MEKKNFKKNGKNVSFDENLLKMRENDIEKIVENKEICDKIVEKLLHGKSIFCGYFNLDNSYNITFNSKRCFSSIRIFEDKIDYTYTYRKYKSHSFSYPQNIYFKIFKSLFEPLLQNHVFSEITNFVLRFHED